MLMQCCVLFLPFLLWWDLNILIFVYWFVSGGRMVILIYFRWQNGWDKNSTLVTPLRTWRHDPCLESCSINRNVKVHAHSHLMNINCGKNDLYLNWNQLFKDNPETLVFVGWNISVCPVFFKHDPFLWLIKRLKFCVASFVKRGCI